MLALVVLARSSSQQPLGPLRSLRDVPREGTEEGERPREGGTAERALGVADRFYQTALAHAPIGVALVALDGSWVHVNAELCRILGHSEAELMATSFQAITFPDDLEADVSLLQATLRGEITGYRIDKRYLRADGGLVWAQLDMVLVRENGEARYFISQVQDIGPRKEAEARLSEQALHDALTHLPNRLLFRDRVDQALRRGLRRDTGVALGFVDLDDFKFINDTRGHGVGDELLVQVARRLGGAMRPDDTVARFGGDEFVILWDDVGDEATAEGLAARLLGCFDAPFLVAGEEVIASASAGLVVAPPGSDVDDLLRYADLAMYEAKRRGKSQMAVYRPGLEAAVLERVLVERGLRAGLAAGHLFPAYQPVVNLTSGAVEGFEMLARWTREGVVVPAEDFIGVADSSGLLVPLTEVLLGTTVGDLPDLGITGERALVVNVTASLLTSPSVVGGLDRLAALCGSADRLVIEMAETELLELHGSAARTLRSLRTAGLRFSVDDFGVGYSALSMLSSFEPDILKVDRSFVGSLAERIPSAIVESVCRLAEGLGIVTVAEGIERPDQLARLRDLGCHSGQGFLLGRPEPAEAQRGLGSVNLPV